MIGRRVLAGITAGAAAIPLALSVAPAAHANSTCTYTQGYYKNHEAALAARLGVSSLTVPTELAITAFFGVSQDIPGLITIFDTAPKGGDANLIAAHQFIATAANGSPTETGDFGTAAINTAFYALHDYFFGRISLTRDQLIAYGAVLDAYNNGLLTLPHC